jgi:beta-1,4-mannosyl-glycoprotein beta-1,4-N-acetylglucosaminyltransferase
MIVDTFTFFNELDLLEIRLEILDPYVDFFVLTEAPQTFSGLPKPLYFKDNMDRFKKWDKKIVHNIAPVVEGGDAFNRAFIQKEFIKDALAGFVHNDTTVFYGDLDEVWNPEAEGFKGDPTKVYSLEQLNYCYYLNNRSSERWVGTIVGKWGVIKTNTLAHWRATHTNEVPNAGWHFTNMGGEEQIKKKLEAYDHQEFNTIGVKIYLNSAIESGRDYVGRSTDWEGKPFDMWVDESELPRYIIDNKTKYATYFK